MWWWMMELWPCPSRAGLSAFCAVGWWHVVQGRGWHVDFHAHAHDLLACLCEKGTLLPLEKAAGWTRSHLGKAGGRCRGEEGHELVACGRCGVLAWARVGILGEVDVWGGEGSAGEMGRGGESPRSELGERGRLEGKGCDLGGGGLRSGAVAVDAEEEEEGEGEWPDTGRRWKDIGVDKEGKGGGDYIPSGRMSRRRMTDTDRRRGRPVLEMAQVR